MIRLVFTFVLIAILIYFIANYFDKGEDIPEDSPLQKEMTALRKKIALLKQAQQELGILKQTTEVTGQLKEVEASIRMFEERLAEMEAGENESGIRQG